MKTLVTIILSITILCSIAYAKLYVWVDKDGIKHVSNIPPKEDVVLKKKREEGFAPPLKVKEDLILSKWFPLETKSGYTISGEVKNNSNYLFKNVIVRATVRDNKGKILIQMEVKTQPPDISPYGAGKFEIKNVKTNLSYLSKTNLRFDLFNSGKVETGAPPQTAEKKSSEDKEPIE